MKKFLSVLALAFFVSSASFASFPVKSSSNTKENAAAAASKKTQQQSVVSEAENSTLSQKLQNEDSQIPVSTKKAEKAQAKLAKKEAKADKNPTVAIILALVSVLLLPFGLHNWYLGRKKQALWQTLLVIPGFILLLPPLISWIWQIVDLIRLLINGDLPS